MGDPAKGPPDIGGLISLKVDNFPFSMTDADLRGIFSEYGDVKDCYIPKDRNTGQSRGFGFIRYASEEEVERAVKGVDGREVNNRQLRVQVAQHGGRRRQTGRRCAAAARAAAATAERAA